MMMIIMMTIVITIVMTIVFDTSTIDTPIQNSIKIYHLLQMYNIDMQPIHYSSIIKTAVFDFNHNQSHDNNNNGTGTGTGSIKLASTLFKKQINIDDNGYVPLDSTLGWDSCVEMGLYSIAMNSLNDYTTTNTSTENSTKDNERIVSKKVVEDVMSAVEEMCLLSPTDQERCKFDVFRKVHFVFVRINEKKTYLC
jgi:hypothetical protein